MAVVPDVSADIALPREACRLFAPLIAQSALFLAIGVFVALLSVGVSLWSESLGIPSVMLEPHFLPPLPQAAWDYDFHARITWSSLTLLFLLVAVGVIANAVRICGRVFQGRPRTLARARFLMVGASLLVVVSAVLCWRNHWGPKFWGDLLDSIFQPRGMSGVLMVLALMLGMAYASAGMLFTGSMLTLVPPASEPWRVQEVRTRLGWARTHLFFGTALLTLGVADLGVLGNWASLYFVPETRDAVVRASEAVTIGVGILCSAIIAAAYLPPALELRRLAEQMAGVATDNEEDRKQWIERHGLGLPPAQQILRVSSILLPSLLGTQLPGLISLLTTSG